MNTRRFIIGDIHGCSQTLNKLLFEVLNVTQEDYLYFLGDFIDRGPRSKKVIKQIIRLIQMGFKVESIIGNHEIMLLESINDSKAFEEWLRAGGRSTLTSFKVSNPRDIKPKYLDYIRSLKNYIALDEFIIVHGGLDFSLDDPLSDSSRMAWIRNQTVEKNKISGKRIIVGHTPVSLSKAYKSITEDRIMLDGGCVYSNLEKDLGYLIALELNSMKIFSQKCVDWDTKQ
ncbi:MAG: metallophosphoesterase [Candidatus Kapabacteria bacterium]|nr:metallophosphoesterase [Candidatus Kapabacteria bacterium]